MLLILVAFLAANITVSRMLPGGEWFFLRWSGARAFLVENIEPYSTELAQRTQEVAYGRRAFSSEYAYVLNDPLFIVLLYAPIVLIQNLLAGISPSLATFIDFAFLRGLWMLLSQIALVGTVLLSLSLAEWEPPRWVYAVLLVFGLFNYFSVNALISGTPAIILGFLYVSVLAALRAQSDELAGALLALVAYQWEAGGLFFLYILFMVATNRRWGVLAGFGMALFVLLAISFMVDQGWGLPYIRAVISDWIRGANLTFGHILSNWVPDSRFSLGGIVAVVLGFILFVEWVSSVDAHFRRVVWTAALSLAVTPLMGFAIFPSNHVVLLLPFILILALVWERWQRRRVLYTLLILILVLGVFYALYARSLYIYEPLVTDLMSVLPPIAAIIGLYWMRWWAVRSPRIWLDRIGEFG
ncbi:MAG TPA: hypothetical protein VK897_10935 [Anaerolineales bacterium]|nr:hypothetical protein [Anaerolineales bacterium]